MNLRVRYHLLILGYRQVRQIVRPGMNPGRPGFIPGRTPDLQTGNV